MIKIIILKITIIIIIFINFMIYLSCSKNNSDYFPIEKGARWEYTYDILTGGKKFSGKWVVSIGDEININGDKYFTYIYSYSGVPGMDNNTFYIRRTEKGIMIKRTKELEEIVFLPSKLDIGEEWASDETNCKITAHEDLITTETDYKNCIKIEENRATQNGYHGSRYYSKGIGLVRWIVRETPKDGSNFSGDINLVKYSGN